MAIVVVAFTAWKISSSETSAPLSENEMRVEYRCDRPTEEYLETDVYCDDYNKYLQDYNSGSLVSN